MFEEEYNLAKKQLEEIIALLNEAINNNSFRNVQISFSDYDKLYDFRDYIMSEANIEANNSFF